MEDSPTLYRHVITAAWRMAWRHKFLWVYGFFASILASGGIYDVIYRGYNDANVRRIMLSGAGPAFPPDIPQALRAALESGGLAFPPVWALVAMAVVIIAGAAIIWASAISQGALVAAGQSLSGGRTPDSSEVFRAGLANFWPVLGVNFISRLVTYLALFLTALPVSRLLSDESPRAALLYIISFLAFVPLALVFSLLSIFAVAAIVIRRLPFLRGLAAAWTTFSRHWLVALEMAFVLLAVDLVLAIGVVAGSFLLMIPFTLLFLMVKLAGTQVSFVLVAVLGAIAFLSYIIAAGSFTTVFRYAAWTSLYLRLEERGGTSKIVRILRAIPRYLGH